MIMKWRALILILTLPVSGSLAAEGPASQFDVSQPTMVPGTTLQPGNYSVQIVDHLQDRYVLKVEGTGGSPHTLFIGVPSKGLKGSSTGPIMWSSGPEGKLALKGFVFPRGGQSVEFVYPKDDAVALAKANSGRVLAVDPASEGKAPQLSNLSSDEMKMVTLWMLTPQPVTGAGAAEPSITASKYSGNGEMTASSSHPKAPLKALPHTASDYPSIFLIALIALAGATLLRARRLNS